MIVICALAKNEEDYVNEWVKFHLNIGFDKIYIYDNGNLNDEPISKFIDTPYLKKIEIIDIRGRKEPKLQHHIYSDFYQKYGTTFDWCAFIDIDEFFFGVKDIKEMCSKAPHYIPQIRVKWKLFGDDDLIERDMSKPVYEVFKKRITSSLKRDLTPGGSLERQAKCIVRGNLKKVAFYSPHFASYDQRDDVLPSCLPNGRLLAYSKVVLSDRTYDMDQRVFLHHYMTKSLSEFVKQKLNRNDAVYNEEIDTTYYWRINKQTKEKLVYLKSLGII